MLIGVPREIAPAERRAALTPPAVASLVKRQIAIRVQSGLGLSAGFVDEAYAKAGATVTTDLAEVFAADVILQVRTSAANSATGAEHLSLYRDGQLVIGHADPLTAAEPLKALAGRGVTLLAIELVPRITRAQAMDALSSQANLAGYKAVLMAAEKLAKIMPMLMTAAGTIQPASVLVLGAGVAGLQAIATARRLGAVVYGWDVRTAAHEQIRSLGAKVLELQLDTAGAEGAGGYAKALSSDQERRQQEALATAMAKYRFDAVITTAAIPGRPSPKLIIDEALAALPPGAVIVDLAAERGGNCTQTVADQTITTANGVTIIGTLNIPSLVANHATQMYAGNLAKLVELITDKTGRLTLDEKDEIIAGMLVAKAGEVVHPRVRETLGLPALVAPAPLPPAQSPAATPPLTATSETATSVVTTPAPATAELAPSPQATRPDTPSPQALVSPATETTPPLEAPAIHTPADDKPAA